MMELNPERFPSDRDNISLDKSSISLRSHGVTGKRIAEMSKKIENVEFLIRIEEKNRKQVTENFNRHYTKLEKFISKYEVDIDESLKSLKEKEKNICEVQRNKFAIFKDQIKRYDKILKELENRQKELKDLTAEVTKISNDYYHRKSMLQEDLLSYKSEVKGLRRKNDNITQSLKMIEDSYPKEFDFLLNDIISEKEIRVMAVQNKLMQKDIEKFTFDIQRETVIKGQREDEIQQLEDEIRKYTHNLETSKGSNYLTKLESFITESVTDILLFDNIKAKVQDFYLQKHFDLDNEYNAVLFKNLQEKMKAHRAELVAEKGEKLIKKNYADMFIDEMTTLMRDNLNIDKVKITKEVEAKQAEVDIINQEINKIDQKLKKREAIFNRHLIMIKQQIHRTPQESYFENNTALLLENEFSGKIRNEILADIDKNEIWTLDEKQKSKNLIEVYFNEIASRDKLIEENIQKKLSAEALITTKLKQVEEIEENITKCNRDIVMKTNQIAHNEIIEKLLLEKVNKANKDLSAKLLVLNESDFEKYLNLNDNILKAMLRIHGMNNVNNIFNVKKQKFVEKVLHDHAYKKNRIGEFIRGMYHNEGVIKIYNVTIQEIEEEFKDANKIYCEKNDIRIKKIAEYKLLEDSRKELKEKIEEILATQLHQIELEKKDLQIEFNQNYDLEKFQYLERKLYELKSEKKKIEEDFIQSQIISEDKENKLFQEENSLINHLKMISKKEGIVMNASHAIGEDRNTLFFEDFKIVNTDSNHKQLIRKTTLNSDKIQSFIEAEGVSIFKKFNNMISTQSKFKAVDFSEQMTNPDKYGYAMRIFKINPFEKTLEVKNFRAKIIECKIPLTSIKAIMLDTYAKNMIKKFTKETRTNSMNSRIPFTLVYDQGSMELMSVNYPSFKMIQGAFAEILKHKKNIKFDLA